jgi:hypothetical protein
MVTETHFSVAQRCELLVLAPVNKQPADQVLKHLARYTHRVALSHHRLVSLHDGRVTFRYQDDADDQRPKLLTLEAVEFWRRFLQHVWPKGFVKIRHYGLLANRPREAKLAICRQLLLVVTVATLLASAATGAADGLGVEPARRPHGPACGGERFQRRPLVPARPTEPQAAADGPDTS